MSGWICSQSDWRSGEWEHGYHKRGPAAAISDPGGNFPSTETGRKLGRVASHQQTPQTSFEISPFRPPTHSPLYLNQFSLSPLSLLNPQSFITMASRTLSRAIRAPLAKQLSAPARRTFVSAINASARPTARAVAASAQQQQVRGVKTIDFAGTKEDVYGAFSRIRLTLCLPQADIPHRESRLACSQASGTYISMPLSLWTAID
jgi:hypothetical protein